MGEITINQRDLPWERAGSYQEGTEWKVLRRGSEGEPKAAIIKLPPEFEMNEHTHVYTEHHYVLEGQYESRGKKFAAGFYRMIPRHTNHGPFKSADGALILVVWED